MKREKREKGGWFVLGMHANDIGSALNCLVLREETVARMEEGVIKENRIETLLNASMLHHRRNKAAASIRTRTKERERKRERAYYWNLQHASNTEIPENTDSCSRQTDRQMCRCVGRLIESERARGGWRTEREADLKSPVCRIVPKGPSKMNITDPGQ